MKWTGNAHIFFYLHQNNSFGRILYLFNSHGLTLYNMVIRADGYVHRHLDICLRLRAQPYDLFLGNPMESLPPFLLADGYVRKILNVTVIDVTG